MLIKGAITLPTEIKSLLLIQLGDIGDVVLATPTMRALRERFPDSHLTLAVRAKARGLPECCPWLDQVVYVEKNGGSLGGQLRNQWRFFHMLRKHRLDLCIDLRTGTRGAIMAFLSGARVRVGRYSLTDTFWRNWLFTHLVRPENENLQYCAEHGLNILAPFGIDTEHRLPLLEVPEDLGARAKTILASVGLDPGRPFLGVQPFSLWRYKEWGEDKFIALLRRINAETGIPAALLGSNGEWHRADAMAAKTKGRIYNLAGMTSLGELAGILRLATLMIGCDSAGIHIAAAVGTPTVSIFGPSSPVSWAPRGPLHQVVQQPWDCVPCRAKGCQGSEVSRCLAALPVDAVAAAVFQGLESPPENHPRHPSKGNAA